MAKISIVNYLDGSIAVAVDGSARIFPNEGLFPAYASALHFDMSTQTGSMEYVDRRRPTMINDSTLITPALEKFMALAAAEAEQESAARLEREARLRSRDYAKAQIDSRAGSARARFIPNDLAIEQEYRLTFDQAQAYRNRGYTAPVPSTVQSHAEAFGCSTQEAANDIIATSAKWFSAIESIRKQRLIGKARIDQAPDGGDYMAIAQPYIDKLDAIAP